MKNVTIKKDDKNIIYTYENEAGEEQKRIIPIYDENGNYNPELREILNTSKKASKQENAKEEIDDEVIETNKHKVVKETPGKPDWLTKANYFLAGGILIAGIVIMSRACGREDRAEIPVNTDDAYETIDESYSETTLEDLQKDSRYTNITEDMLVQATQNLIKEYADHGIELNGEDALTFVTIANITHLEKTNPELLSKVLGNSPDAEATLTKVGHIIGQVVTLEVTTKDEQADWTIALLDETDKKIAQHGIENVIAASKVIAANTELSEKEKATEIQKLVEANYVKANFDKTVGYDFTDGTHTSLSQEDGADFITDAILTGILMGDNALKNYIYGSKTFDAITTISWNEDVVSNIMRMIEECQNVEVYAIPGGTLEFNGDSATAYIHSK